LTVVPSPIALFVYSRPQHLRRALEALCENPEARDTVLYVYSDAPRDESAAEAVREVRRVLQDIDGFAAVHVTLREQNVGLAHNITGGISDVLSRHDDVIVVEDDLIVSRFFLRFMNDALIHYRHETRVASISGYCYPLNRSMPETFFIRGADCWGWATWRDRWRVFNSDGRALLTELRSRKLTRAFDLDGTMGYTRMLVDQIAGRNDSWAIRWHASCFLRDLLTLYPARSLTSNVGHDGTGTHSSKNNSYDVQLSSTPIAIGRIAVEESVEGRAAFADFCRRTQPQLTLTGIPRLVAGRVLRGWNRWRATPKVPHKTFDRNSPVVKDGN
jgi:hypothetical protein